MTVTEERTEQAPAGRRRPPRRSLLIAGAGAAVAVAGAVYVAGWTPLMGVHSVQVEGPATLPQDQLIATAGIAEGTPMMQVDLRAATARLADLPQLASVDVRRQWPRTIVISVTERDAVAMRKAPDGWELLDANGSPFAVASSKPKDLPVIAPGADAPTNTAMLQALAAMTPEIRAQVAEVSAQSPVSIRLTLRKSDAIVNWGSAQESDFKSAVLAVLLQTKSGWYDVSNPQTPTTAEQPPVPKPAATASPDPSASTSVEPSASPSPEAAATPETSASPVASPTAAVSPLGVVTD